MESIEHRIIKVNGINIHVAEKGQGPVILLLHGFPELWYTWRHQIASLASLGYRAVAPDLRGFGDSDAPPSPETYSCFHAVGDIIALIDEINGGDESEKVFVVGHDWGALIGWYLCLFRPEKVKALVNLTVPFNPRNPKRKPLETLRALYGDDYYIMKFQEPGFAEAEFAEMGTEKVIKELFTSRSPKQPLLPKGKGFGPPIDKDAPIELPDWFPQQVVDYYVAKFDNSGFTGGINYYRNIDRNWELMAPWSGAQIKVPVKFIIGDLDITYNAVGAKDYIHKGGFKRDVPSLEELVVMEGVGHFIVEEKSHEITQHIYDFVRKF